MVQVRFSAKRNSGNAHILEEQEKSNAQFGELYRYDLGANHAVDLEARSLLRAASYGVPYCTLQIAVRLWSSTDCRSVSYSGPCRFSRKL